MITNWACTSGGMCLFSIESPDTCLKCRYNRTSEPAPVHLSMRFNKGKLNWGLFPMTAAGEVVKVLMYGARKYTVGNWQKGCPWVETWESAMRHMILWRDGEDIDPESGCHHLAHVCCNMLFLLWYWPRKVGQDDRKEQILREGREEVNATKTTGAQP